MSEGKGEREGEVKDDVQHGCLEPWTAMKDGDQFGWGRTKNSVLAMG